MGSRGGPGLAWEHYNTNVFGSLSPPTTKEGGRELK